MENKINKIGKRLLIVGVIILLAGILFAFTAMAFLTGGTIIISMIINTIGLMMLRYKGEDK